MGGRVTRRRTRGVGVITVVSPVMPRGYEALQADSRFFQPQLGGRRGPRLGAATVTWSIAPPQVQGWARTLRTLRDGCVWSSGRTSNFDYLSRGWARLSLLDSLMYCFGIGPAWETYVHWRNGAATDATQVLNVVNAIVGALSSIPGVQSQIDRLPAPLASIISAVTADWRMTVAERDMFLARDRCLANAPCDDAAHCPTVPFTRFYPGSTRDQANGIRGYCVDAKGMQALARGSIPTVVVPVGAGGEVGTGMSLGVKIAIALAAAAALTAGGLALTRRRAYG